MKVATTYQTVVERTAECVSTLDVLCGLAHTADYSAHGYCQPTLTDSDEDGAGIVVRFVVGGKPDICDWVSLSRFKFGIDLLFLLFIAQRSSSPLRRTSRRC